LPPEWMRGCQGEREQYHMYWDESIEWECRWGVELVRIVAQMLVLGVLIGFFAGKALIFSLRLVHNDTLIEPCLLVATSYLVFWLAELVMMSSAVIAVVVLGLYVNKHKAVISYECLHFTHSFYELMAYMLNTILFTVAGMKLGTILPPMFAVAAPWTFGNLLIYPIILFARGVSMALCFPLLKRLGTGCTWKEAVISWWGGLRGSVGLALALQITHTSFSHAMWGGPTSVEGKAYLPCRDIPADMLFMTTVVVTATVIINGCSIATLMRLLEMVSLPSDRKFMLKHATAKLARETDHLLEALQGQDEHKGVDWQIVEEESLQVHYDFEDDAAASSWLQAINIERMAYMELFEKGELSDRAFNQLEYVGSWLQAEAAHRDVNAMPALYATYVDKLMQDIDIDLVQSRPSWKVFVGMRRRFVSDSNNHWVLSAVAGCYETGQGFLQAQALLQHVAAAAEGSGHGEHGSGHGHGAAGARTAHRSPCYMNHAMFGEVV